MAVCVSWFDDFKCQATQKRGAYPRNAMIAAARQRLTRVARAAPFALWAPSILPILRNKMLASGLWENRHGT